MERNKKQLQQVSKSSVGEHSRWLEAKQTPRKSYWQLRRNSPNDNAKQSLVSPVDADNVDVMVEDVVSDEKLYNSRRQRKSRKNRINRATKSSENIGDIEIVEHMKELTIDKKDVGDISDCLGEPKCSVVEVANIISLEVNEDKVSDLKDVKGNNDEFDLKKQSGDSGDGMKSDYDIKKSLKVWLYAF